MRTVKPNFDLFDGTRVLSPSLVYLGTYRDKEGNYINLLTETVASNWVFHTLDGTWQMPIN